jgi:glycosyltransferase involved in cell wall biosynthesis
MIAQTNLLKSIKVIRHPENKGVGAAFDAGVKVAKSDRLFLTGCDVRFSGNGWASKMVAEIDKHPKSLICTAVLPLQEGIPEITFEVAKKHMRIDDYKGAAIKFFSGEKESQTIINASWLPREFLPLRRPDYVEPTECYPVPCILGASYGVTKKWYKYIDGFWGHKFWGTLEPLISLKSWMFGGDCLTAPFIETAHIFKNKGSHADTFHYGLCTFHNKFLICMLLFPYHDIKRFMDFPFDHDYVIAARRMIEDETREIMAKRDKYRGKIKMPITEYATKFNLKYEQD